LVRGWVIIFPALEKLKELLRASLLEHAHERTLDGFYFRAWYFGNLAVAVHVATSDLLELEVLGDIGVYEDLGQFTRSNDKFGYKIDGIVAIPTQLSRWLLVGTEVAVELSARARDNPSGQGR
jgi:hypothetical protein